MADIGGSYRPSCECPILLGQSCGAGEVEPVCGADLFELEKRAGTFVFGLVSIGRGVGEGGPYFRWLRRLAERGEKSLVVQRQITHCPTLSVRPTPDFLAVFFAASFFVCLGFSSGSDSAVSATGSRSSGAGVEVFWCYSGLLRESEVISSGALIVC